MMHEMARHVSKVLSIFRMARRFWSATHTRMPAKTVDSNAIRAMNAMPDEKARFLK
jgi:hypothetical protein